MIKYEIQFLEEAKEFLDKLDNKSREKILFNIWKSRETNDPKLFKKLTDDIWEFRTLFNKKQFRLFAFWVRKYRKMTLVVATHGIIKKTQKTPKKEIERAEFLRKEYLENN
jgi:phage-related protein